MLNNVSFIGLSDNQNKSCFITPWAFIHMFFGFTCYVVLSKYMTTNTNFITMNVIHTLYECKDIISSYILKLKGDWFTHSFVNSIGDAISAIIGWYIAYVIFRKSNINNLTTTFIIFANIITAIVFDVYKLETS